MLQFGKAPFLECSSKGDKRFSAFYARLKRYHGKSIEELYQAKKKFTDGRTNLSWREAKGRQAINMQECAKFYRQLWREYVEENPELLIILKNTTGYQDVFGQQGHCCQAEELYLIHKLLNM